jgi:hypothetical protein
MMKAQIEDRAGQSVERQLLGLTLYVTGLLFLLAASAAAQETPRTLRKALAQVGVPVEGANLANLEKPITSGAELNDDAAFVIAYFVAEESNRLDARLFVHRYDKRQQKWTSASLPEAPAAGVDMNVPCLGSVLSITEFQGLYLLNTHLNPSAGCILILTRDLQWKTSLYGWFLAGLGKNRILYHRSQIHFAAAHPMEMGMYDLATGRDATLFPPKQATPIRTELTQRLGEFFAAHQDWCNVNNHPCDPGWFDSALFGDVATSSEQDAVAFVVSYGAIQYFSGDKPPTGPTAVLYVYRYVSDSAKLQVREMLLDEAKRTLGVSELKEFLAADRLTKLFEP